MRCTLAILILFASSTAYGACDPVTGICTPDPAPVVEAAPEPAAQPQRTIVTYRAPLAQRTYHTARYPALGAPVRVAAKMGRAVVWIVKQPVEGHRRRKTRRLARRAERGNQLAQARLCRMVKSGRAR